MNLQDSHTVIPAKEALQKPRQIESKSETTPSTVIPAKAGIQERWIAIGNRPSWIPAFAGMTALRQKRDARRSLRRVVNA